MEFILRRTRAKTFLRQSFKIARKRSCTATRTRSNSLVRKRSKTPIRIYLKNMYQLKLFRSLVDLTKSMNMRLSRRTGRKKYAHTFAGDSKLYLTIAGLPKYNSTEGDIKTIDQFKLGIVFKKCKLGKKYLYIDNSFELDDDNNIVNKRKWTVKQKDIF